MTLVAKYWPRGRLVRNMPVQHRLFTVAPDAQILGLCHWQAHPHRCGTVLLVHGLEGCGESHYMKGLAAKAWSAGLNVIRLNQRTCGNTEHLAAASLYNCGLSTDIRAVVYELITMDQLTALSIIGYSMGGNLVLKMAGEITDTLSPLIGIYAVCPTIDPSRCLTALEQPTNRIYHDHFLRSLKSRIMRKARIYPDKWDVAPLHSVTTIRQFDDIYTAPDGGYSSAAQYYERSASGSVLPFIRVPSVIIAAEDDPFVPHAIFDIPGVSLNSFIQFIMTRHGGHCGFFQQRRPDEDHYWAENRLIELIVGRTAAAMSDQ